MPINNSQLMTPSKYFWSFKGSTGKLSRYDKETEQNVEIDPPMRFIVLDELNTVKGFNKALEKGIWANEVRDLRTDDLHINNLEAQSITGKYGNLKDKLKANGGKFAKSVYIIVEGDNGWEINNVTWSGASVGAWFDINKKINTGVEAMIWDGAVEDKTGAIKYFVPTFKSSPITPSEMDIALELNKELQQYLDVKLASKPRDVAIEEEVVKESKDVVVDDFDDDEPIDLSEIPF